MVNIIKLEVDGYSVAVKAGSTVRQAADVLGIELPRFCYHERLRVAGNCRICLVEVIGSPKPVASCAIPASNGMKVFTSSPLVKKARESVIELLRANHPLDCPICDQGGECDLQDQSMRYGSDRTRIYEAKRGVEDKYLGPLVKIVITRCIHCTRCIRFASEVAGIGILGTSGRGSDTEVGTYIERIIDSELSGNLIDRCPVGALTSKPIAFKARSWELDSVDTYDDSDSLIASIRMQVIGNTVYRVLPRNNDDVNGQWLADKGRFIIDAYNNMRAKRVIWRISDNNYSIIDSMIDGFDYVGNVLDNIVNPLLMVSSSIDIATISVIKSVSNILPVDAVLNTGYSSSMIRNGYKSEFGSISGFMNRNTIDMAIMLGTDLRKESPVVNTMIRNGYMNGAIIVSCGLQVYNTYPVASMSITNIVSVYNGTSCMLYDVMKSDTIATIAGSSVIQRDSGIVDISVVSDLLANIMYYGNVHVSSIVLHTRANVVGSIMLGIHGYDSSVDYANYSSIINIGVLDTDMIEQGISSVNMHYIDKSYTALFTQWLGESISTSYDVVIPLVINHEQESRIVSTEGRYNVIKKVITGVLSSDIGSVNSITMSSYLLDGKVGNEIVGGYYNKRMSLISAIYEGVDSEYDVLIVPSVHDYYIEGHSGVSASFKMRECSSMSMKESSFSE